MLQENRTFDTHFGKLNDYRLAQGLSADANGLPPDASNPDYAGTGVITAFHLLTMCTENTSPSWNESHVDHNRYDPASSIGLMNGFVYTAAYDAIQDGYFDTKGVRAMGYYDYTDIPYYYFMATQFATSDNFFSPVPAGSPANHEYLLAGTSAGYVYTPPTTLSNKTIFQLLQENGISWKVYEIDVGSDYLDTFQPFATEHASNIVPVSEYFSDLANGTLPAVAMISAGMETGDDEHPGTNVQVGAAEAATLINALMNSSSWKDSVFILSWDEGGGLYDHVPNLATVNPDGIPPLDLGSDGVQDTPGDFTMTGFRVPLLVVSPFTKPHYISHTPADYTAILKLIETRFNLPSLTLRDAAQPDMTEFFDLVNVPNLVAPTPPTQPTNAPCDYNLLPE